MKKIMIQAVLLLLICGSLFSQDPCADPLPCFDDGCDSAQAWVFDTKTITFPQFPNCSVEVDFCLRECKKSPHHTQFRIKAIRWLSNSCPDCLALYNYIFSGSEEERHTKYIGLMEEAFQIITYELFVDWIEFLENHNISTEPYYCSTPPEPPRCTWKSTYTKGSCAAFCVVQYPVGYDEDIMIFQKECVEDYCCKLELCYCIDSQTSAVHVMESRTSANIDCEFLPAPSLDDCPPGNDVTVTNCRNNCPE